VTQVAKWFERKFDFSFPVELYPNLRVRLRGTPARIEEMLQGRPRSVLVKSVPGSWSAQEHAGHLLDLDSLWMARVDDFLKGGEELTAADLTNRKTYEANHNARQINEILRDFRTARSGLVDRLDALPAAAFSRSMLHPRLKQPMRLADHLYFAAEHDDHHLASIWELVG